MIKNKIFKNKKFYFLLMFYFLIFFSFSVNSVFASVDKIVFINEPQVIKVGEFSKQYQIQLQNSSGEEEDAPDTIYFTLPLDIGLFYSNTSTSSIPFTVSSSIYIATNSSNKYFYFKNNIAGEYLMKVFARNKNNTKQWETEQMVKVVDKITESANSSNTNSNSTSTNSVSSANVSNIFVKTKVVYISTHSGEEDLSNYDEKVFFKITAGRERLVTSNSPVEFDAKYFLLQKDQCSPFFRWSFGDGFELVGKNIEHIYKYPGEYQVVLNGSCGDYKSVSRTMVKVIFPNVLISNLSNGDVEIINNDKTEINIGNWKIKGGQKDFSFSKDTIINAGKKIILSKEDIKTDLLTNKISLFNSLNKEIAFIDLSQRMASSSQIISMKELQISEPEKEKLFIKDEKQILLKNKQQNNKINLIEIKDTKVTDNEVFDDKKNIQTASVLEAVNSSSSKTFWSKIIDIPIKNIKSFAQRFYDF